MVQWLRFHIPNAEGPGSIPGQEIGSHTASKDSVCLMKDPTCLSEYSAQPNK